MGKSFTSYFITCLLIGVHRNYAQCLETENLNEIRLWKQTELARLLNRFPIYASNPKTKLNTFAEIITFCQKFYPRLGELLSSPNIPPELVPFSDFLPEDPVKRFLWKLAGYSEDIVIIVDQVDNMIGSIGPSAASEFLGNFVEVFKGVVSASSNLEIFISPLPAISKLARIQAPIFQFDDDDLFELLQLTLSQKFNRIIHQMNFCPNEVELIKEHLREAVCGIASNIGLFAAMIKKCYVDFAKKRDVFSPEERISRLSQAIVDFISAQRTQIKNSYREFLQRISQIQGMAESNEKSMSHVLYGIPVNVPANDLTFDRRLFFISTEIVGHARRLFIYPISSFMIDVICDFHEALMCNEEKIVRLSGARDSKHIEGKHLELWWVNHALKTQQVFLDEYIPIDQSLSFGGITPLIFEAESNILFHPTNSTYPIIDAVFLHNINGIKRVCFIQITKIAKSSFASKVTRIQHALGLSLDIKTKKWSVNPEGNCNAIFTAWMKKLVEFGFEPETTEFEFWLIYKGDDSYMKSDQFLQCFNHLCFNDSDSEFENFLNCKSHAQYLKYYNCIKKSFTAQSSKRQRSE